MANACIPGAHGVKKFQRRNPPTTYEQAFEQLRASLSALCRQGGYEFCDDREMAFDVEGTVRASVFVLCDYARRRTFVVYPCPQGVYGFADGGFLWAQENGSEDWFWTIPDIEKDRVLPDDWQSLVLRAERYFGGTEYAL